MNPFQVDPRWYEKYWYGDEERRRRRPLAGVAILLVLALVGLVAMQLRSGLISHVASYSERSAAASTIPPTHRHSAPSPVWLFHFD
jgi:hypothetical protein